MDAPGGVVELSWRQVGGVHVDKVAKGDALRLSCGPDGGSIANVLFASFGTPRLEGTPMRMIQDDICHATNSTNIIEGECIRRESCTVSSSLFSDYLTDVCGKMPRRGSGAAVACTEEMAIQVNASIPAGILRTTLQLPAHRFAGAVDVFEGERLIYSEKGDRESDLRSTAFPSGAPRFYDWHHRGGGQWCRPLQLHHAQRPATVKVDCESELHKKICRV